MIESCNKNSDKRYFVEVDIQHVEARFDTSSYELEQTLLEEKKLKSNCINKSWISWKNNDRVNCIETKNI